MYLAKMEQEASAAKAFLGGLEKDSQVQVLIIAGLYQKNDVHRYADHFMTVFSCPSAAWTRWSNPGISMFIIFASNECYDTHA